MLAKNASYGERHNQRKEGHMENQNIRILTTSRGPVEYLDTGNGEVVLSLHGAIGGYDHSMHNASSNTKDKLRSVM